MQLTFDTDVEEFRAEFSAFLDEQPPDCRRHAGAAAVGVAHAAVGARLAAHCCSTTAGCCPHSRRSSAAATPRLLQTYVHAEELCRRRIYHSFNPQGVNIIAASLLTFGSDEQKQQWAVPVLRGETHGVAGHERAERGVRPCVVAHQGRSRRPATDFVVNGQKVWTSGAHDADFLLTFVRTDPGRAQAQGHQRAVDPDRSRGRGVPAVRRHLR